ncbi:MAG: hypothetical protein R3E96_04225 [Planctomycetota bacterium]
MFDHDSNAATPDRHCQTLIGMDGENGFAGAAQGTGAVSQVSAPSVATWVPSPSSTPAPTTTSTAP